MLSSNQLLLIWLIIVPNSLFNAITAIEVKVASPKNINDDEDEIGHDSPISVKKSASQSTSLLNDLKIGNVLSDLTMETGFFIINNGTKRMKLESVCELAKVHFELHSASMLITEAYKTARDLEPSECLQLCRSESSCMSVNIDYKKKVCNFNNQNLRTAGEPQNLKSSPFVNFFEKICLSVREKCPMDWAFERVKGKELVGITFDKVSVDAASRQDCESACLNYQQFPCLSAEYNYQMNECRLSPYNRFSSNDKKVGLKSSASLVDYLENNCAKGPRGFCSWKIAKQNRMTLADKVLTTENINKCQEECLNNPSFICRSFTFDSFLKTCSLSHHSRRSISGTNLVKSASNKIYEVSTCFDVSVDCEPDIMRAKVISSTLFQGKIYARERPYSCFVDVSNKIDFSIAISLKGEDCGTLPENEGIFANTLVIQSNDQVVTAFDKAVGIRCSYEVANITGETTLQINEINKTYHERSSPMLPDLSLHIVDLKGSDKDVVDLGELLKVQVRMSDEDTYGIFVRNLIAKDNTGQQNLTLIDQAGCPVGAKFMREVKKMDRKGKSLETYFEAFSFTGSNNLQLEAEVETCIDQCKPVQCRVASGRSEDNGYEFVTSYGRRRRSTHKYGVNIKSRFLSKSIRIVNPSLDDQHHHQRINLYSRRETTTLTTTIMEANSLDGKSFFDFYKSFTEEEEEEDADEDKSEEFNEDRKLLLRFKPSTLTIISLITLVIQALFLTMILVLRFKKNSRHENHISDDLLTIY